jgi:hypothetical protein
MTFNFSLTKEARAYAVGVPLLVTRQLATSQCVSLRDGLKTRSAGGMMPMRANIVGPPSVATKIRASIAACHSDAVCSAFGSLDIGASANKTLVLNWRGVRRVTPNPSFSVRRVFFENAFAQRYQPACKPGFVGHRPLAPAMRDGHSSGTTFARGLEQPTRTASLTSPRGVFALRANEPALPSLFGLAPGVVCHAVSVAGPAVRSYRTFSPLLAPTLNPSPASGGG